jgi:chemotaxis protein MotB
MRPSTASSHRPERCAAALLLLALAASGCVTRGTHQRVVQERDRLAERVTLLEASNESLSQERVQLIDSVEDLRQEREALAASVEQLTARRADLETSLETREAEVAASRQEIDRLRATYDGLVQDLQSEVAAGRIQIEQLREGLRLNLAQEVLFPPGSAELGPEGDAVMRKVAARLAELPHRVEVQGHSDDRPITGALARRYPTNWELAGARAASVVRLLERLGVDAARLQAVSFGATRPVASNDTPDGRARNRRIELRLVPPDAPAPEPRPLAPADGEPAAPAGGSSS